MPTNDQIKVSLEPGAKFNRLTAVKKSKPPFRNPWVFHCECGNETTQKSHEVISGRVKSCGCYKKQLTAQRMTIHGLAKHGKRPAEYISWCNAKARCSNPKNPHYKSYGAVGITVCDRWASNFNNFISDMGRCPKGYTLERIDVYGDYRPENCKWATRKEQSLNRRATVFITYYGVTNTLFEFCAANNIPYGPLRKRLKAGQKAEDAVLAIIPRGPRIIEPTKWLPLPTPETSEWHASRS